MPDDAAKTTDATAPSAGDAKAPSARDTEARRAPPHTLPREAAPSQRAAKIVGVEKSAAAATGPDPLPAAATDGGAALTEATAAVEPAAEAAEKLPEHSLPGVFGASAAPPVEGTLIGSLDADERIRQSIERNERTLWAGAAAATLIYAALIGGQMVTGLAVPAPMEQRQKERRGQGAPDSISVEIVPDPDKTSKTKHWREGARAQAPNEQPPTPSQTASLAQPEVPEREQQKQEDTKQTDEPRSEDSPMLLDIDSLVDAAAQGLKREIDRHYDKERRQRTQQAMRSGGGMQVRGRGASGRSDPFTRSVIAALMKTRPGPAALWARVLVSFQVSESGKLAYVHLLQSSGNSAMDQAAINAIRRARFKRPPPGLSPDDRTYIIDYIFG
jgi:TonB family protein